MRLLRPTSLVLLAAAFTEDPIRDAVTLASIQEAHLEHSAGYLAIAPVSSILDTLTLLGARQHIVVIVSLIVVYAAIRIWHASRRRQTETVTPRSSVARELTYAALFFVAIVLVYTAAAVLPRPMAALAAESSDVIVTVDFHSHSRYSHDGRPGWEPADVRSWHRSSSSPSSASCGSFNAPTIFLRCKVSCRAPMSSSARVAAKRSGFFGTFARSPIFAS
jgi:hypothetical protein